MQWLKKYQVKIIIHIVFCSTLHVKWAYEGFSSSIGVAGEYSKITGGLLWMGKALSENKKTLTREFCVAAGEFSDLQCLMYILLM